MAATGGRVLALRSVEFARNHHVQVHVRSSFTWAPGTWVTEEDPSLTSMEQAIISGVTHDASEAKVTIEQVPDRPGVAATWFRALADAGVNVDMIVQNVSTAGPHRHLVHGAAHRPRRARESCMDKIVVETEASGYRTDARIGRVSLIGAGMKTNPGVAAKMFEVLADRGHQHRDDQHVDDPDLVRGRRRRRGAGGARAAHRVRTRRSELEMSSRSKCSVGLMGATGLVGTEMLRILEERAFPVSELRAYASARSLGPQAAVRRRRGDVRGAARRDASTVSTS